MVDGKFGVFGCKVPVSGVLVDRNETYKFTKSIGEDGSSFPTKGDIDQALQDLDHGRVPQIASNSSFLTVPEKFQGRMVIAVRFSPFVSGAVDDGIVIDRDTRLLLPRKLTNPFSQSSYE